MLIHTAGEGLFSRGSHHDPTRLSCGENRVVIESLALAAHSPASDPSAISVARCQSSQKYLASLRGRHWSWRESLEVASVHVIMLL